MGSTEIERPKAGWVCATCGAISLEWYHTRPSFCRGCGQSSFSGFVDVYVKGPMNMDPALRERARTFDVNAPRREALQAIGARVGSLWLLGDEVLVEKPKIMAAQQPEANTAILKAWMGKKVRQVKAGPEYQKAIGRESVVDEGLWDEKGALHLHTADGYWCPAAQMEIVD